MKKLLLCMAFLLCMLCCAQAEKEQEIDWSRPVVALTFDDGPGEYTLDILQLLEENGCRATFFMLADKLGLFPEVVQAMAQSENEIGTHTWAHENLTEVREATVMRSLSQSKERIEGETGRRVRFFRPPYGAVNGTVYQYCKNLELVIIIWSLDSNDWQAKTPDEITHTILSQVQNGDIILCHDIHANTAEAMKTVLPALVAQGYQLVTVSELFSNYSEELHYNAKYSRLNLEKVNIHK